MTFQLLITVVLRSMILKSYIVTLPFAFALNLWGTGSQAEHGRIPACRFSSNDSRSVPKALFAPNLDLIFCGELAIP